MIYEEGWLIRRIESGSLEYNSWPDSIKKSLKLNVEENEEMSEVEYKMRYDDSRKYGNY